MVNANDNLSEFKLIAGLKPNIDFNKKADFFLSTLATGVKQDYSKKKKKRNQSNQCHQACQTS